MEKMTKAIIVWKCPHCRDIVVSCDWERHTMNYCKCKKNACDMEEGYVRWIGDGPIELKAKYHTLMSLVKKDDGGHNDIK